MRRRADDAAVDVATARAAHDLGDRRAVAGEIAFASTKSPSNGPTERATSSAACGGQTESTTSLAADLLG